MEQTRSATEGLVAKLEEQAADTNEDGVEEEPEENEAGEEEEDEDDMTEEERSERTRWLVSGGQDSRVAIWSLIDFSKT